MNKILFETLEKIHAIQSPFVNTHDVEDKYSKTIQLMFRFKDLKKNDDKYLKLINIINNFKGEEKWVMKTFERTKNYIITPRYFYDNQIFERTTKNIQGNDYKLVIDKAINDLPKIIEEIKLSFDLK